MWVRLCEVVLRLAPRWFRQRYGDELLDTIARRRADRTAMGGSRVGDLSELVGLGNAVLRLRLQGTMNQGEAQMGFGNRATSIVRESLEDLRFSLRSLMRNRSFALSSVVVVALGIGATTAIFSAVNSYFFRPLPFADPEGLVMLYETNPEFGWTHATAAPANVFDWRERVDGFGDVMAYSTFASRIPFMRDGEPEVITGSGVTGNFFSVLGVQPVLGRGFRFEETWAGGGEVVVLSHGMWVTHFGSDPSVVGSVIEVGGNSAEVVGVAPPGFRFPLDETQFWHPMGWERGARSETWFRRAHLVRAVARLDPAETQSSADQEFQAVVAGLQIEFPETNRVMGAGMMPLRSFLIKEVQSPLLILLGSAGLLLLLACVNVANLTLLRAEDRGREVTLRRALGAGKHRVMRLMVTESVLVGLAGGALGMGLGWIGVRLMNGLNRVGIEGATSLTLDSRVVGFTLCTAILCGVLFGVLPALRTNGARLGEILREAGRGSSRGKAGLATSNVLVSVEVALAVLLVVSAGLTVRNFWILRDVDPGFEAQGALAVQFTVPSTRYQSRDEVLAFYGAFTRALEARPGVERAGLVQQLPLNGTSWSSQFQAEGWPPDRVGFEILHRRADRGYFEALQIPLIRGRLFEPTDEPDGPLVVVINETFARQHFPGEDPIGQRIAYDRAPTEESYWYEIVGIVGDQNQENPGVPARAEVFENSAQDWGRSSWVVLRTQGDALASVETARNVLREADPLIPISRVRLLTDVWNQSLSQERFLLFLLSVFGVLALLLAIVGVYTVSAQAARRRSRELGIRIALGAGRGNVIGLVLKRAVLVVGVGVVVGVGLSVFAGRLLASQLLAVEPTDPFTMVTVVGGLSVAGLLASFLPAHRATRIDPGATLRIE